jgi:UDP-N-acetyl-D-galactosamine dehydrogenase
MITQDFKNVKIAVIGLGYVGLPLAVEFGKKYKTIGFNINLSRIEELKSGYDRTRETSEQDLKSSRYLQYESNLQNLDANVYIVTVPTPIDAYKKPDLTPLIKVSETVGKVLKRGDIVITNLQSILDVQKKIVCQY